MLKNWTIRSARTLDITHVFDSETKKEGERKDKITEENIKIWNEKRGWL